jgi:hypothetical protein
MKPHVERVTKLDAVRRQLRTAIRMFFEDKDGVSAYTLAAAVEGILGGLLKKKGERHPFRDNDLIRPERKDEFLDILNRPRNFFKHAAKDPNEVLEFNAVMLTHALFESSILYQQYTGRALREGWVFFLWFGIHNPGIVQPGPLKEALEAMKKQVPSVARGDKTLFLELLSRADLFSNVD